MRRNLLGIIAIVLVAFGLSLMWLNVNDYVANSAWRIGLVLGALWLALPQLQEMSRWFARAAIAIAVVAALMPRYGWVLLPLIALLWAFRSRGKPAVNADAKRQ